MTGSNGFFGNQLTIKFIKEGHTVLFLTDNSEWYKKAIDSLQQSSEINNDLIKNFQLIECSDMKNLVELKNCLHNLDVDEIWQVLAHMSYDFEALPESVRFNSVVSTNIMKFINSCKRYYFISTTGVAGIGEGNTPKFVKEELLTDFNSLNPYTASKVLAEYMLWNQSIENDINLTIIRPGSIIGDSITGFSNGTKFGYYSYLYPLKKFQNKKMTFYLNVDPAKRFPVIHINHLVDMCCSLHNRDDNKSEKREVFHACNTNLFTAEEHFHIFEEISNGNLKIGYGEGETGFNKVYNKMNADNNRFMAVNCEYDNTKLINAIGIDAIPPRLTIEGISKVIETYMHS